MSGRKVFGSNILTSSDVNEYLMDQSVMVFANATARSTGIPVPTEGMVTYLQDVDELEVYNGSSWLRVIVTVDDDSLTTTGGITSTQGNITASAGFVSAGQEVSGSTGVRSTGTTRTTGLKVGAFASPAVMFSSAGDNFNIRTHTNTPNPNFSLGVQNGSGTDTALPVHWENGTLRLRGSGTTTATGIYLDSNNVPRYATAANVYGWHIANAQMGTQLTIGAWAASGMNFGAANTWITIGSVGITIPTGTQVIVMNYGFTMYVNQACPFLVRVFYNGGGTATSDFQYYRNLTYDHFAVAGPRGLGVTGGTSGTIFLQVYGQGGTVSADSNDSGYFTVSTV